MDTMDFREQFATLVAQGDRKAKERILFHKVPRNSLLATHAGQLTCVIKLNRRMHGFYRRHDRAGMAMLSRKLILARRHLPHELDAAVEDLTELLLAQMARGPDEAAQLDDFLQHQLYPEGLPYSYQETA